MPNKRAHQKKIFALLVIFIVAVIVLFTLISPQEIVNTLGVRNAYLVVFLVSLFGGFSAGGSFTFITVLIALAAGGINPVYLGLTSGVSLAAGDLLMFYAGSKGRELIQGNLDKKVKHLAQRIENHKWGRKLLPLFSYLYIGFAPLPNDILLLSLAAIEYPYKRMIPVVVLGDITFALMITLFAANGVAFFS